MDSQCDARWGGGVGGEGHTYKVEREISYY